MRGEDPRRLRPTDPQRARTEQNSRGLIHPCKHQNGWNKKGGTEGRERLKRLFMTVSEKAHGMAKSGLMGGGGVLERGKHRKKTNNPSHMSLSACVTSGDSQKVGKHRLGSSWSKRKKVHGGELALPGTPQPSTTANRDLEPQVARSSHLKVQIQLQLYSPSKFSTSLPPPNWSSHLPPRPAAN